jgi:PTH1 family peptidyl-tRNA hydrolase
LDSLPRLIVGLGNPKPSYDYTRHNVGRRWIEAAQHPSGRVLPSFMNESGPALRQLLAKEKIAIEETLVIVDDFMIPFGSLRLRKDGSAGGHNGLKSIIETFGTENFPRLRVGIGPVPGSEDPADFVLETFTKKEEKELPVIFDRITDGINLLVREGYNKAMTALNQNNE